MIGPTKQGSSERSPVAEESETGSIHVLRVLHLLRSAGGDLLAQAALHGRLAELEWIGEKRRLAEMLTVLMISAATLLCILIFSGVLVLALTWDGVFRIPALLGLIALYATILGLAWRRLTILSVAGSASFAASRAELEADLAVLKRRL